MAQPEYLPQAVRDLDGVKEHIARDNPRRALSFVRELRQTCERLAERPLIGRARPELRPGLRSLPHGDYNIFCHPLPNGMRVVRLLHGAREIRRLF